MGTSRFDDSMSPSLIRSLCLVLVVSVAVLVLAWMYIEQAKVQLCTDLGVTRPLALQQQQQQQPIQVILQQPASNTNRSKTGHDEEESERYKWNYNWDYKAWSKPEDAKGVATRTIILVRHGQYDLQTGKLTDKGRQQANLTGLRLKAMNSPYDEMIHSTLERAVETAELAHKSLVDVPLHSDLIICEGGPVKPDPTISYWGLPQRSYFVDGPRLEAAFRKYFFRADKEQNRQSYQILVGHGNIFRFFALRALQLPKHAWMRVFIAHASITVLHINPDGTVNMAKFGDSGHLPPELVTY